MAVICLFQQNLEKINYASNFVGNVGKKNTDLISFRYCVYKNIKSIRVKYFKILIKKKKKLL